MAMSKMKMEILEDVSNHFANQLRRLMTDTAETCLLAELDRAIIARMLMGALLSEAIQGANSMRLDEREFMLMCRDVHRLWTKTVRQVEEEREEEQQRRTH